MEVSLIPIDYNPFTVYSDGFNPCFNGSSSYTVEVEVEEENKVETTLEYFELEMSFNPCFNGSSSYTF